MDDIKAQFDAKYRAAEDLLKADIDSLTEQAETRAAEIRRLQGTIESYKISNEELNVGDRLFKAEALLMSVQKALTVTSAGSADSEAFVSAARELDRIRKTHEIQFAEFETVKKSLMKDLQNRCEKVVELEMQLDEVREQYKVIARSANSKAQQRKLDFLEHNLDQLNVVQKQASRARAFARTELTDIACGAEFDPKERSLDLRAQTIDAE